MRNKEFSPEKYTNFEDQVGVPCLPIRQKNEDGSTTASKFSIEEENT
jgi:hypothetical protein